MDEQMPEFYIIAGPNGAGKSTHGHLFVPPSVDIFNGDLVFADLIRRYPDIEPIRLQGGVAHALEQATNNALASKAHFAFESNYSSDMASEIVQNFKVAGYKVNLIYFGLEDLEISSLRVKLRHSIGGHYVSPEVIKYNFEEGVKRVNKDLHLFDNIVFVDTAGQKLQVVEFYQKTYRQQQKTLVSIKWYKDHFEASLQKLNIVPKQVKKVRSNKGFNN